MATVMAIIALAGLAATVGGAVWASSKQQKYAEGMVSRAQQLADAIKTKQREGLDLSKELSEANQFLNSLETDIKSGKYNNSAIQSKIESVLRKRHEDQTSKVHQTQRAYEANLNDQQNIRDKYSTEEQVEAAKLNKELVGPQTMQNIGQTALYVGAGSFENNL